MICGRVCTEPSLVGADASVPVFVSLGRVLVSWTGPRLFSDKESRSESKQTYIHQS